MAIKERKQITGTTAQINAYEGHEGQIVWDKDKKTFVGMSGTAGKNYPLAPKEYVDKEVAKKASSAELTQGLAGKEDKGTCLPLTGGTLSGKITFNHLDAIGRDVPSDHLVISGGRTFRDGATLALFGKNINDPRAGGFEVYASKDTSTFSVLQGLPNGSLLWGNKYVLTGNTGSNHLKLGNKMMLQWGQLDTDGAGAKKTINFPSPWPTQNHYSFVCSTANFQNQDACTVNIVSGSKTNTSIQLVTKNRQNNAFLNSVWWFAFGWGE